MKIILMVLSLLVFGCMTGESEKDGPKVIGYSAGYLCGITPHPTCLDAISKSMQPWAVTITRGGDDTVKIYAHMDTVAKRKDFSKSKIGSALFGKGVQILDEGGQCLTIHQTGKDTVVIEGVTAIVDVPIEPCLPYLLDKDLP